jgi:hypothetical protein
MTGSASALTSWESFYVIVGSSRGALIGLQFVVITLIAGSRYSTNAGALGAFGTPTVVHLTGALLVSAFMSAPLSSLVPLSVALGICGLGGLAYGAIVIRRAVCQLRGADGECRPAVHRSPAGVVRHRLCGARSAAHRHPQRLGYGNAHRRLQRRRRVTEGRRCTAGEPRCEWAFSVRG